MNALQQLIHDYCAQTGESYTDIARRGEMARQTVQSLAAGDSSFRRSLPRPDTLDKLAVGMSMDNCRVHYAAAKAAGFHLDEVTIRSDSDEPQLNVLVALGRQLSPEQRRRVEHQIAEILNQTPGQEPGH